VTHRNAPLSVEGRRRLVVRCQTRPIAHVATERVSHEHVLRNGSTVTVRMGRSVYMTGHRYHATSPQPHPPTSSHVSKFSAEPGSGRRRGIAFELSQQGVIISRRTVSRHVARPR
jgi:hypothetical protein